MQAAVSAPAPGPAVPTGISAVLQVAAPSVEAFKSVQDQFVAALAKVGAWPVCPIPLLTLKAISI